MGEQGGERAGGDAFDPRGLAEGRGPDGGELLAHLVGKAADRGVVEVGRQAQVFVAAEGGDIGGLAVEIAGIGRVDLDLLAQRRPATRRSAARSPPGRRSRCRG